MTGLLREGLAVLASMAIAQFILIHVTRTITMVVLNTQHKFYTQQRQGEIK
jgi:hypothetical protein